MMKCFRHNPHTHQQPICVTQGMQCKHIKYGSSNTLSAPTAVLGQGHTQSLSLSHTLPRPHLTAYGNSKQEVAYINIIVNINLGRSSTKKEKKNCSSSRCCREKASEQIILFDSISVYILQYLLFTIVLSQFFALKSSHSTQN